MADQIFTPKYGVECFGATRNQAGRLRNEDAFVIDRNPVPHAAVFDGAGNAEQAARRVVSFFQNLIRDQPEKAGDAEAWAAWVRLMDSHLLGGAQSTFVGAAVPDNGVARVVGGYAGNARAYLVGEDGVKLITAESSPARLGSGNVEARSFALELRARDILLLMSDGAWVPFSSPHCLKKAVTAAALKHFSEVPEAVLEAATPPDGPPDDMTVVALRLRRL
jgi:serine/threonine protein phosphatase PrpC